MVHVTVAPVLRLGGVVLVALERMPAGHVVPGNSARA
jgi:hypothetical protein